MISASQTCKNVNAKSCHFIYRNILSCLHLFIKMFSCYVMQWFTTVTTKACQWILHPPIWLHSMQKDNSAFSRQSTVLIFMYSLFSSPPSPAEELTNVQTCMNAGNIHPTTSNLKTDVSNTNQGNCHWVTFLTKPCHCVSTALFSMKPFQSPHWIVLHTPMLLTKGTSVSYTLVYLSWQIWYNYFYRWPLLIYISRFCAQFCFCACKLVLLIIIYKNSRL